MVFTWFFKFLIFFPPILADITKEFKVPLSSTNCASRFCSRFTCASVIVWNKRPCLYTIIYKRDSCSKIHKIKICFYLSVSYLQISSQQRMLKYNFSNGEWTFIHYLLVISAWSEDLKIVTSYQTTFVAIQTCIGIETVIKTYQR